jgi:hypothetical protein
MKTKIHILIGAIVLCCQASYSQLNSTYRFEPKTYTIKEITGLKNAYIIDVYDNENKWYSIISLKTKEKGKTKIQQQQQIKLILLTYDSYDPNITIVDSFIETFFIIGGKYVDTKMKYLGLVVTTPNLKGLYYVETE